MKQTYRMPQIEDGIVQHPVMVEVEPCSLHRLPSKSKMNLQLEVTTGRNHAFKKYVIRCKTCNSGSEGAASSSMAVKTWNFMQTYVLRRRKEKKSK